MRLRTIDLLVQVRIDQGMIKKTECKLHPKHRSALPDPNPTRGSDPSCTQSISAF